MERDSGAFDPGMGDPDVEMQDPGPAEDRRNVGIIGASAVVAMLVTALFLRADLNPDRHVRHTVVHTERTVAAQPLSGVDRLYGTVTTKWGQSVEGYLRWDRNEGSWSDLLDADKADWRGQNSAVSGIRFGHIQRIEPVNSRRALFTLRSGEQMMMSARATDLGSSLRALLVTDADGKTIDLDWSDIEAVDFEAAPNRMSPTEYRISGTLTTRSGLQFNGPITWDVDEIYSSDVLDGDDQTGRDMEISFGEIRSIERNGPGSARVVLHSGAELVLSGSNDVDRSNSGISVSDVGLGQVKVDWRDFDRVDFRPDASLERVTFDGGRELTGTVITDFGEELRGTIRWDNDEAFTWEMLNGSSQGVEFHVEFGNIARIMKTRRGATVELNDGRVFGLRGSNDVDNGNRGIVVQNGDRTYHVDWSDFVELRLDH